MCVFVCAVYICAHTSRALDVSRCNNIKLYRQPIHILFTSPKIQYKRFLGGTLSLFLSLSSSLRPHSKMKCVLCACGECECEPILAHIRIYAYIHAWHAPLTKAMQKQHNCHNCTCDKRCNEMLLNGVKSHFAKQ